MDARVSRQLFRKKRKNIFAKLFDFIVKYKFLHLLSLPGIIYFVLFHYVPLYGIIIAFKDYNGFGGLQGIYDSPWIGFQNFNNFFDSSYFWRLLSNTFLISFYQLLFGFPAPIILALLLNEIRNTYFKRIVQTITYMPHFLSWVVIAGLMTLLLNSEGVVNHLLGILQLPQVDFLTSTMFFRSVLVSSSIWHGIGWGTIVYLAAIVNVPRDLYEAAEVEGANRWQKVRYITIPSIMYVIVILFILEMGKIIDGNFEQILNLYNPAVYSVADTFDTFVYRRGIVQGDFSYSAAVGIFKSITSFILVILANRLAKMLGQEGIW